MSHPSLSIIELPIDYSNVGCLILSASMLSTHPFLLDEVCIFYLL